MNKKAMEALKIKLCDVFEAKEGQVLTSDDVLRLPFKSEFVRRLSELYRLPYEVSNASEGNVCFAGSKTLRPEYRTSFSRYELIEIIRIQLKDRPIDFGSETLLLPAAPEHLFSNDFNNFISVKSQKQRLRKAMLQLRDTSPRLEREHGSSVICDHLWKLVMQTKARSIHSYLPMGSEVNVAPFLQKALNHGLTVVVPKTLKNRKLQHLVLRNLQDLEAGIFNTYHPKNGTEYIGHYDLIVVAGLAFTPDGYRVGYGGGYYDSFLSDQPRAHKVGVCFAFQVQVNVPQEAHDVQLDRLVSN